MRKTFLKDSRPAAIAAATAVFTSVIAQADALTDFNNTYIPVEKKLESLYSQIALKMTCTLEKGAAKQEFTEDVELLLKNGKFRYSATCKKSSLPAYPVGTLSVAGGEPGLFYSAKRRPGTSDFTFSEFGTEAEYKSKLRFSYGSSAFAPFCITDQTIPEILADQRFVIRSVVRKTVANLKVVQVDLNCVDKTIPTQSLSIRFDPKNWVILSYEINYGKRKSLGKNTYSDVQHDGLPRIVSVERWDEIVMDAAKSNYRHTEINTLEFGPIADDQLTPQAAGLTKLPATQQSSQ